MLADWNGKIAGEKRGRSTKSELLKIPGVGKSIARDFVQMGYVTIDSLKGQNPQEIYEQHCALEGYTVDRCFLYVCRCAVYFAENTEHDPEKLKWWNWKDNYL